MASYLTRDVRTYLDKVRESSYNTPQTTGTNYERLVTTNAVVPIPNQEIRTDQGRAGSEFASAVCNTYWEPTTISVSGDGDFAGMGRLALRAVGGTITDATVVTSLAFSHTAPMLPGSSGLQLPSFNMIAALESSGASYLYTGCVVDRMRLTKEAGQIAQLSFDILGSGKHRGPHAVTSLPSAPSFSCLRPYGYVSYDNGSPIDLSAGCRVRSFSAELNNNHSPANNRCDGDSTQDADDYTASGGASDAAYLSKLEHGDRTVSAEIVLELDGTFAEKTDLAEKVTLTNFTLGYRGNDLDPGGTPATTYELFQLIFATAVFQTGRFTDVNGKACVTLSLLPITSGTSVVSVKVQNGITATNYK